MDCFLISETERFADLVVGLFVDIAEENLHLLRDGRALRQGRQGDGCDLVPVGDELFRCLAAQQPGPADHKYVHGNSSLRYFLGILIFIITSLRIKSNHN